MKQIILLLSTIALIAVMSINAEAEQKTYYICKDKNGGNFIYAIEEKYLCKENNLKKVMRWSIESIVNSSKYHSTTEKRREIRKELARYSCSYQSLDLR